MNAIEFAIARASVSEQSFGSGLLAAAPQSKTLPSGSVALQEEPKEPSALDIALAQRSDQIERREKWMRGLQAAKRKQNYRESSARVRPAFDRICKLHGITYKELMSGRQIRSYVRARADIVSALRDDFHFSLPHIGLILGMHHTSVLYLLKKYGSARECPPAEVWNPDVPDLSGEWAI